MPYGITAYGGSQVSEHYQSYSIGAGQNLGRFGALSIDVTHANSTLSNDVKEKGQSYRFRYNKNINDIGTNIALAGYRYSTKGFYSLAEVFDGYRDTNYAPEIERRRNRGEITLSQNLGIVLVQFLLVILMKIIGTVTEKRNLPRWVITIVGKVSVIV